MIFANLNTVEIDNLGDILIRSMDACQDNAFCYGCEDVYDDLMVIMAEIALTRDLAVFIDNEVQPYWNRDSCTSALLQEIQKSR